MRFVGKLSSVLEFDSFGEPNIRLYYWISVFSTAWFQLANWVIFALFFISEFELGILEAVSFAIGLLVEIPSGAIADMLGKRKTIIIGLFLQASGSLAFTLGFINSWLLLVGNILIVGFAFPFISGSFEALVYDTLIENKKIEHYDYVASRSTIIVTITLVLASAIGGVLWKLDHKLPWIASTISFFVAFVLSFGLREPKVDTEIFSWNGYKKQLRIGFAHLLESKNLKFTLLFVFVLGTFEMWSTGILRIFMGTGFGFDGEQLAYVASTSLLIGAVASYLLPSLRKRLSDIQGIYSLLLMLALGFLLAGLFSDRFVGLIVFTIITVVGRLLRPWISIILNKNVESRHRATTISTLQFFVQIPYVLTALFIGYAAENSLLRPFYLFIVVVLLGVALLSKHNYFSDKK